jgi:hypothetical protein
MRALVDIGFTHFITGPPAYDAAGLTSALDRLAETVIAPMHT